jgi:pimeloyl-ACP methyl ester carboxylesterase
VLDDPIEPLKTLAAYLVEVYGTDNARMVAESWTQALRAIVESGGDVSRSRAGLITCPALLMTGTYDPFCPPSLVREMADAIPGGQFLEAPGAGHDVHQSHPDWLVSTVVDWLGDH